MNLEKEKKKKKANPIISFIIGFALTLIISDILLGLLSVDPLSTHVIINMALEIYILRFIIKITHHNTSRDKKKSPFTGFVELNSLNFKKDFNALMLMFFVVSTSLVYYLGQRIGMNILNNSSSEVPALNGLDITPLFLFTLVLSAVVVAPIVEETICRYYFYNFSKESFSVFVAVFVNSFIFAILHGSLATIPYTFALGVLLSFIVYCYGSVVYSIIAHMILNAFSLFVVLPPFATTNGTIIALLLLCCIIVLISYISIVVFGESTHL